LPTTCFAENAALQQSAIRGDRFLSPLQKMVRKEQILRKCDTAMVRKEQILRKCDTAIDISAIWC